MISLQGQTLTSLRRLVFVRGFWSDFFKRERAVIFGIERLGSSEKLRTNRTGLGPFLKVQLGIITAFPSNKGVEDL
jgi:hypothetical protein